MPWTFWEECHQELNTFKRDTTLAELLYKPGYSEKYEGLLAGIALIEVYRINDCPEDEQRKKEH